MAGYSGTPLPRKLGIADGHRVAIVREPQEFRELLGDFAADLDAGLADEPDVVIAFSHSTAELDADLDRLAEAIHPDRALWLAWPKKSSGVESDLSGDVVRSAVLATDHLVDVKVCAISDTWSGLKIMWRKDHRRGDTA